MEHMYDLGLKQCLCNFHDFYVVYKHWLVSMCMHDMHTAMYVAYVDRHGAMPCTHDVYMHICGAMAHKNGLQGSHGTLYGSREQEKHSVHMSFYDILWFSMHA